MDNSAYASSGQTDNDLPLSAYGNESITEDGKTANGQVPGMLPGWTKRRIMKNILIISLAFLFNFNAYQGLARLQSTLHKDEGMGVINQSVLYACLMISCFFLPTLVINTIGHKWTMPLAMIGYILWMGANGFGTWAAMVPASILVGICAAPLWTAQCSYFTLIGGRYSQLSGETEEAVISRFFGIFFMFFQLSSITGSIISSTILRPTLENGTEEVDPDDLNYCGRNFCPDNNITNPNLEDPEDRTVWIMVGVYMAIAACAIVILCIFVDPLPKDLLPEKVNLKKEVTGLLIATAKHLGKSWQLLLIPLTMYSGFEQAFYNAEFTQSFVSCSLGIWKVGLVTLPFGVVNAIVSFSGGQVIKYIGRLPVFIAGLVVDLAIQITLMLWLPTPDTDYVLFILAGMWGFTDGIWQTQINALYGVIFSSTSEAAFSNYRMWESLGFIIAFAYSSFLCTSKKTYILTSVLCVAILLYFVVEFQIQRNGSDSNLQLSEKEKPQDLPPSKAPTYVVTTSW